MHKRHTNNRRLGAKKRVSANSPLAESAQSLIMQLPKLLMTGEELPCLDYLRDEYLSKFCAEDVVPAAVRRKAAVDKWLSTELKNASTNARLRAMDRGFHVLPHITFYRFLEIAQRLIAQVLGDLRDEIVLGSFSGGASTSRARTESRPAQKFVGQADITMEAMPYTDVIHREAPLLRQAGAFYHLREVEGAVLFTVPKKSDIDRCACKEPDVNMFLQKGVGKHIRRRLRKFGIDLNDQSVNRRLARVGSIDGSLATLDLSSASDTVTISCVQALLPTDWFLYLNDIRSRNVVVDGHLVTTEMFSSMGNGFTFELESLIFWALMKATAYLRGHPGVISVYGDDIIIPSGMYDDACWVLEVFGFTPNPSKSFATGPFRESCGGHYWYGEDITPFYLKRPPTHLTDLIRVCNQLRRWAMAEESRQYMLPELFRLWRSLAEYVPSDLWGGHDVEVDTQLACPGVPINRLVRSTDDVKEPPLGAYLLWHNTNWNRSIEPNEPGFEPARTDLFCRRRRSPIWSARYEGGEFYEELIARPLSV
ncbi:RNA-directed RNA polymerase [ssRNA phage SRR7976310_6]|uniref:RNA-directed RNA polymerase n=1 Tax=ssRNA phage SRR7976310_6 TaxID=2786684 RepID=A0A8S5L0L1_9VIRU|nr:RNA-directed RNA polymerase [ssRNA phage SRR7976310_6]DAD51152.1 TPA_asm: RNA-directed RNA polymerase [ssRNA phage SRR7976310_6]